MQLTEEQGRPGIPAGLPVVRCHLSTWQIPGERSWLVLVPAKLSDTLDPNHLETGFLLHSQKVTQPIL